MTQRVADGLAVIRLSPFISVINYVHTAHGLPNPNENRAVRQVRDGLRRTYGVAPVRQAHPISVAEIRTLVTGIDRATLGGARDAAFILVGYACALRIGELAALAVDGLESRPDGIVLRIRRSKTDRNAAGAKVAVARGKHPDTDPIAALQHGLRLRGTTPGSVFVPLRGGAAGERGLAPHTFGRLLKARAETAGLPNAERITGHSLRAGHATAAHRAGVPIARIAAQARHRDLSVLFDRYIRPVDAFSSAPARTSGCDRSGARCFTIVEGPPGLCAWEQSASPKPQSGSGSVCPGSTSELRTVRWLPSGSGPSGWLRALPPARSGAQQAGPPAFGSFCLGHHRGTPGRSRPVASSRAGRIGARADAVEEPVGTCSDARWGRGVRPRLRGGTSFSVPLPGRASTSPCGAGRSSRTQSRRPLGHARRSGAIRIASADVEGYVAESDVAGIVRDYLLVEADSDANVVLHVIPDAQYPHPDARLRLAADLAEHRRPREEARAAELLHELAVEWKTAER